MCVCVCFGGRVSHMQTATHTARETILGKKRPVGYLRSLVLPYPPKRRKRKGKTFFFSGKNIKYFISSQLSCLTSSSPTFAVNQCLLVKAPSKYCQPNTVLNTSTFSFDSENSSSNTFVLKFKDFQYTHVRQNTKNYQI